MITFMQEETEKLEELIEQNDSKAWKDHCIYLASQIISSNRTGRAMDRAIKKTLSKRKTNKIVRAFFDELASADEFYKEEQEFYDHFEECLDGE